MDTDNNKKKIIIGSTIGAVLLFIAIASVIYSKASFNRNNNNTVEVASADPVPIDSVMNDGADASPGDSIADTKETEPSTTLEPVQTSEPVAVESANKENENPEAVTPEPTKEPVSDVVENTPEPTNTPTVEPDNTEVNKTNTETASETTSNGITTVTDWGTPQEYYGDPEGRGPGRIIVKGFDYNNIDTGSHTVAWEGDYWTASNGVEIKVIPVDGLSEGAGALPVVDGVGKDIEGNSPYQFAIAEALGSNNDNYNADLNVTIPLASYKRSEIDINDASLVAYRDAYDYKLYYNKGMPEEFTPYQYGDPINLRFAVASDGIGEYDSLGAQWWHVVKVSDYWEVRIYSNLAEFRWDGIHQVLRYLSPDGDALYDVIYEDCYYGSPVILEYEEWFAVGNSQIYQEDTTNVEYVAYRFK